MKDWKTFACLRPQLDAHGIFRIMGTHRSFPVANQHQWQHLSQLAMRCTSHVKEREGKQCISLRDSKLSCVKLVPGRVSMNQEGYGLRADLPLHLKGMHLHCIYWRTSSSFWNGLVWYLALLGMRHWSFFLDLVVGNVNHQECLCVFKDFVDESFNLSGLFYPFIKWTQWKKYMHTGLRSHSRHKAVSGFGEVLIFQFKPKFSERDRLPLQKA